MELTDLIQWAKDICSLATCAALLIRPLREWLLGTDALREGQRCLLRSEIVRIYYGLTATAKVVYTVLILLVPAALLVFGVVRCTRRRYR